MRKFSPGKLCNPESLQAIEEAGQTSLTFLQRHCQGDWGDIDVEDRRENERGLLHGFRLLSAYNLQSGKRIWIITEADRSATTILLVPPEEY